MESCFGKISAGSQVRPFYRISDAAGFQPNFGPIADADGFCNDFSRISDAAGLRPNFGYGQVSATFQMRWGFGNKAIERQHDKGKE